MATNPDSDSETEIVFVCTANVCRSPMAQALLRRRLADLGVQAQVSSAGVLPAGLPAADEAQRVLADRGAPLNGHVSRSIDDGLPTADLIIAMARMHVREIVMRDPALFDRTFTLKELVRRGEEMGGREADESMTDWAARLNEGRRPTDHLGDSLIDDVADPVGRPAKVFRATADELDDLLDRLVALGWKDHRP